MKKKIPENASTIIYIAAGIFLAVIINQAMGLGLTTDMPVVAVESNSMIPTFYKGDLLVLQGVPPEQLAEGDIIVFIPEGSNRAIVHRIIAINGDGTFQTKGDANANQLPFEKRISTGQIHGKKVAIIPYLGWVKIGVMEIFLPNIGWIALGGIILYAGYVYGWKKRPRKGYKLRR
ncbi:MAG: signal peptidase I [Candidatus Aenigmarchaeota archaeon]